jgi:limonene-1,2-epoxide hydrolase
MSDSEAVVRSFFEATAQKGNFLNAVKTYLSDDADWRNTGFPTANGMDEIVALSNQFIEGMGLDTMRVELVAIASSGGTVLTERIDYLQNAAGEVLAELIVSGTLEVGDDGKITSWRDYWDPRPLLPPA